MKTPARMSLVQLAIVIQGAPERPELWTRFELDARDEYDRRVCALEARRVA